MRSFCTVVFTLILSFAAFAGEQTPAPVVPPASRSVSDVQWERQKFEEAWSIMSSTQGPPPDQALALLKEIHARNPNSPYLLVVRAHWEYLAYAEGRRQVNSADIREACMHALRTQKDLALAYVVMANVDAFENDPIAANENADAALRLEPNRPEVLAAKAGAQKAAGNLLDAERWMLKAFEAHTLPIRKSNILVHLSMLYEAFKPVDAARIVETQRKAVALDPNNPWKHARLAALFNRYHTDRQDEAVTEARRSIEIQSLWEGRRQLAVALYGKWAVAYERGKAKPDAVQTIVEETGFTPDMLLVNLAESRSAGPIARSLLKSGLVKGVDRVPHNTCCTALGSAARANNLDFARVLVKLGANIHAVDSEQGRTPLYEFAVHGNVAAVEFLLASGARVNITDRTGWPLTHMLAYLYSPERNASLSRILDAGADVELPNLDGSTLLGTAARAQNGPIMRLLLARYKTDPNGKGIHGEPALVIVATRDGAERLSNARLLLDAGANPWVASYGGRDVLQSLEHEQPANSLMFPNAREIAVLIREARKRVAPPPGFVAWAGTRHGPPKQ